MVTQLQSEITTHLLFPRRAFLSPWGATSHAKLQSMVPSWFRDSNKKGEKYLTPPTAAGREAMRKSHSSPPVSSLVTTTHPQIQSRAALRLTLLSIHPGLSTAARDCSVGQGGNLHGLSLHTMNSLLPPVLLFPMCLYLYTLQQHLDPHVSAWPLYLTAAPYLQKPSSLQPVLQQVWALHGSREHAASSTNYLCSQVHTHHPNNNPKLLIVKTNPNIFVIVQISSLLVHRNEMNGIFLFVFLTLMLKDWELLNKRWLWNMPVFLDSVERDMKVWHKTSIQAWQLLVYIGSWQKQGQKLHQNFSGLDFGLASGFDSVGVHLSAVRKLP